MRPILIAVAFAGVLSWALSFERSNVTPAFACTPGPPFGLESAATAETIAVVEVVEAGSSMNSAPTVTPTSALPVFPPSADVSTTATSSAVATATPYTFDLSGYGATLRVVDVLVGGDVPEIIEAGREGRAFMEREVREREAYRGPPIIFSDCPIEWNAHRWIAGARYLVFAGKAADGGTAATFRYRVEGDWLVLEQRPVEDPLFHIEVLGLQEATYRRYFAGVPARIENGIAIITADRVPLARVLDAVTALRGGREIAPPETGSAGLAARRR
jgi:hypothetical protein